MKIKDLKAGMRVKFRNGLCGILMPTKAGFSALFSDGTFASINSNLYNDAMEYSANESYDIVKVYDLYKYNGELMSLLYIDESIPIWEREDTVEMTMKELEKRLGFPVKIVKEH